MAIHIHPHALTRMKQRGATNDEVVATIQKGKKIAAKQGRQGFQRNFPFNQNWQGQYYKTKQLKVYAESDGTDWLVITVIVIYF